MSGSSVGGCFLLAFEGIYRRFVAEEVFDLAIDVGRKKLIIIICLT